MKPNELFNIDKLMTESVKTVNEINPHNYDSDEDYYNDLHGNHDDEEFDGDIDDFDDEPANDEESHYEKFVRVRGLGEEDMGEEFVGEPHHDGSTFKNSLHTIHRVAVYLNKNISDDDDIPEWVAEKMGAAKGMLTSVMQYLISEKEMHRGQAGMFEQGVAEATIDEGPDWTDDWKTVSEINSTTGKTLGLLIQHANGTYGFYDDRKCHVESGFSSAQAARQAFIDYHNARKQRVAEAPDYAEMFESKLMEFASAGGGAGGIATSMSVGKGSNVGSLFGGSYSQKNSPFKKSTAKKRTGKMIKR